MIPPKEHVIVDENGQRVGVLLDIEDYRQLLEDRVLPVSTRDI